MEKLSVIKIGGNIIDDDVQLRKFLQSFTRLQGLKILVHGGGKLATVIAENMGIKQELIDGRRITDAETLKVITMVYAGFINKNIIAILHSSGCNALGLSGADADIIRAHKREPGAIDGNKKVDYGFAGDVDAVNSVMIGSFLNQGLTLVISPVTHDGKGQLLNTNADTIAAEIASAMSTLYNVSLFYCFEKEGVLSDTSGIPQVLEEIHNDQFEKLKSEGIVSAGMIPKMKNAFMALKSGVHHVRIGHASNIGLMAEYKSGTAVVHD